MALAYHKVWTRYKKQLVFLSVSVVS